MNKKNKDIMQKPVYIDKNQPLSVAMDKMDKHDLHQIPVTNSGVYHGSLTYQDIARELGSGSKSEKPATNLKVSSAYQKTSATAKENDKIKQTYCAFTKTKLHTLSVINDNKITGIIRSQDLLKYIDDQTPINQTNLTSQETETLKPDDRVVHARRKIIDNNYNCLPVIDAGGIAGLLTPREIAIGLRNFRKLVPDNKQDYRIRNLLVKDIMQVNPLIITKTNTIEEIAQKMTENNTKNAVILEEKLIGVISHLDILRYWCGDER
ncbi:CBS domain containing protein [Methanonatronarchaeum thermophilum]|uniref:CBS domain containing protein n=1 Tax=Methanonatronarchaeum thermophilum TaxID=1927129 RepID=A0A1Y3GBR6_9EURY|nr:CBS domain-containing protein [Methanonatronarchaeum thermophilum]OUJ18697.1 CBS domain containing protein [Methanonatronarchaeum thermophilum]